MTKEQLRILEAAKKTTIKNEKVLSGGSKHINPIRKLSKQAKPKKGFWDKLFS